MLSIPLPQLIRHVQILLEAVRRDSGECIELGGLMDNRQVLMPFVNMRLIGRRFESRRRPATACW